jgi:hypothetical protein
MSLAKLNLECRDLDTLESLGLLEDAISNASERRNARQDDSLPELLTEEASAVMGGLIGGSMLEHPRPETCGMMPCDPPFGPGSEYLVL